MTLTCTPAARPGPFDVTFQVKLPGNPGQQHGSLAAVVVGDADPLRGRDTSPAERDKPARASVTSRRTLSGNAWTETSSRRPTEHREPLSLRGHC